MGARWPGLSSEGIGSHKESFDGSSSKTIDVGCEGWRRPVGQVVVCKLRDRLG